MSECVREKDSDFLSTCVVGSCRERVREKQRHRQERETQHTDNNNFCRRVVGAQYSFINRGSEREREKIIRKKGESARGRKICPFHQMLCSLNRQQVLLHSRRSSRQSQQQEKQQQQQLRHHHQRERQQLPRPTVSHPRLRDRPAGSIRRRRGRRRRTCRITTHPILPPCSSKRNIRIKNTTISCNYCTGSSNTPPPSP